MQGEQVVGVKPRIVELSRRQRPDAPIGALELFIHVYAKALGQQVAKAVRRPSQDATCPHCVEQVLEHKAKVPLQHRHVIFGTVQDLEHPGIGKERAKPRDIVEDKGVDQIVGTGHRNLDQAHLLCVYVQAVRLGVHGKLRLALELGEHRTKAGFCTYPNRWH
jgi:hypothetical protein